MFSDEPSEPNTAPFDDSDPRVIKTNRNSELGGVYKVKPDRPCAGFSNYEISSANNSKIVTINAWGIPDSIADARKLQDSLEALYKGYVHEESSEDLQKSSAAQGEAN